MRGHGPIRQRDMRCQYSLSARRGDITPSTEVQLQCGILNMEHRLDAMNLIGETHQSGTWSAASRAYQAFRTPNSQSHPTTPRAELKKYACTCSNLRHSVASTMQATGQTIECSNSISRRRANLQPQNPKLSLSDTVKDNVTRLSSWTNRAGAETLFARVQQLQQAGPELYLQPPHLNQLERKDGFAYVCLGGILTSKGEAACRGRGV